MNWVFRRKRGLLFCSIPRYNAPMEKNLKNLLLEELKNLLESMGQKPYLAGYIFTFIHQKYIQNTDAITPLSKLFRQQLQQSGFSISQIQPVEQFNDPDGTSKFVFELSDGCRIESVRLLDGDRSTFCISTQAGCRMGCLFCATGQLKFHRDLSAAEIIDQVYRMAQVFGRPDNIVYMGMGEPLDNYEATVRSLRILHDPNGQNIGVRHITISTCGLPQQILDIAQIELKPRLAISLHAANEITRKRIMKISNKHTIGDILDAVRRYQRMADRRVTFEYCMLDGINDSPSQASALASLVRDIQCNINLIEFNPFPGSEFRPTPQTKIRKFAAILEQAGIETVIRFKRGQSIKAACGQLGADWLGA